MCDLLNIFFHFITENFKDTINVIFWIITGIIAFLSYRTAKKTLFNPIKGEIIKYQMKDITEFIDKHSARGYTFDSAVDYSNLIKLNFETDYFLDIYSSEQKFENHVFEELDLIRLKFCKENLAGLFELSKKDDKLILDFVVGDFETTKQYVNTNYIKEKERKNSNLFPQRFFLTKRFYDFYTDLINLETNPFIPEKIKNQTKIIIKNIHFNIGELCKLLNKYILAQQETNYQNIYLDFESKSINYQKDLEDLRRVIATYFKVNEN